MRSRTAFALVVVALVALAAGWQFGLRTEPAEQSGVAAGTLVFPGLAAKLATATRIEISHASQSLAIVKSGARWGLADRGGYPVQQDRLRELLTGLTELRFAEARTADPAEYGRLGVEDPQAANANSNLLRVLDGAGTPIAELIVGHRRVRTQGNVAETVYVRRPGQAQSWLAEGTLPVDADLQLWIARDIVNIPEATIAGISVHRGDQVLAFAPPTAPPAPGADPVGMELTAPADHPKLDAYKVEDVGRALEQLTLTDVKPVAQQPGTSLGTADFTLKNGVVLAVSVWQDGKDIWAQFKPSGDGAAKAQADAIAAVVNGWSYQLGAWKEANLVPTLDELKAAPPANAPGTPPDPVVGAPPPITPPAVP